jgi:hypothetical protein
MTQSFTSNFIFIYVYIHKYLYIYNIYKDKLNLRPYRIINYRNLQVPI